MIKDPLEGTHFAKGGRVGFRMKPVDMPQPAPPAPAPQGTENIGQDVGAPPQNPVAVPDDGGDNGEWGNGETGWGGNVPQMGYVGNNRGMDWDSSVHGSATTDWRGGSSSFDRNTGGSFIGDLTGGAVGRQTTGQGINPGLSNLGWGLTEYGNFANIDTPLGSFGLLPGQGLAKTAGGMLLDHQIDAIDSSFDALDGGAAVPGAELEYDANGDIVRGEGDTVTVSDANGNVREYGARQYAALQDLQRNDQEAAGVGRRMDSNGNMVNYNVTAANQVEGANSTWESEGYGNRAEAEAVATHGWGSPEHFAAIEAQFSSPTTAIQEANYKAAQEGGLTPEAAAAAKEAQAHIDSGRGWNEGSDGGGSDYGSSGERDAVANDGWGSDAHFDAIDDQFDSNDSGGDSGGGK